MYGEDAFCIFVFGLMIIIIAVTFNQTWLALIGIIMVLGSGYIGRTREVEKEVKQQK